MKKLLFLSLFISLKMFGQSVTIVPSNVNNTEFLKIKKDGIGLDHRSANGLVGVGTHSSVAGGFIQTHTNHSLNFATNSGAAQMILTTSGRVGVGINPTAQLDVARGTAPDGTAIFRGTTHVSHFNYATDEHTYIRGGKNGSNVYINDIGGLGNVGIGTNTPQAKLHLSQGNLRVDNLAGVGTRNLGADASGNIVALPTESTNTIAFATGRSDNIPFLLATGTYARIILSQIDYNIGNSFDLGIFTAPSAGVYYFVVNLSWTPNSNGIRVIDLRKNNNSLKTDVINSNSTGFILPQKFTTSIYLNTNDQITLWLYQDSGTGLNFTDGFLRDPVFFSGYKVN